MKAKEKDKLIKRHMDISLRLSIVADKRKLLSLEAKDLRKEAEDILDKLTDSR